MECEKIESKQIFARFDHGVNYDYILGLCYIGEELSVIRTPIKRHTELLSKLWEMIDFPYLDVTNMHKAVLADILDLIPYISNGQLFYNYCFGHDYNDSYIGGIEIPLFDIDKYELWKCGELDNLKNMDEKYALDEIIRSHKEEYYKLIEPYLYSLDYYRALVDNQIEHRCELFSVENQGWHSKSINLRDDVKVILKTNFCYGVSSYFNVTICYKGIVLSPYSAWVKYYFAGYNEIINCTRSYNCDRSSWERAFDFIASAYNKARKDPDNFVRTEVVYEVNEMVSGLYEIFDKDNNYLESLLDVEQCREENRFIGISTVRHANEFERQCYEIRKEESAMIFRMEKISGALHFLESLKKLAVIFNEVKDSINRVLDLNKKIYPDIIAAIPPIRMEIKELQKQLYPIQNEYEVYITKLESLAKNKKEISLKWIRQKRQGAYSNETEAEKEFREKYPEYEELKGAVDDLKSQITSLNKLVVSRRNVIKRLEGFKDLINKYMVD